MNDIKLKFKIKKIKNSKFMVFEIAQSILKSR